MKMKKRELLLDAVRKENESKKATALATIETYLESAAGIGEHPQVVEELSKAFDDLATANDVLDNLNKHFPSNI